MIWVNGKKQSTILARDRSIHFGDGCFTTAIICNGKLLHAEAHFNRLKKACTQLGINGVNWNVVKEEINHKATMYKKGVLKAIITRGVGSIGYSNSGCLKPTSIILISKYPMHYHHLRKTGVRLGLSRIQLGKNPALAGIKHLNRLEQVLIRTELEHTTDADEMLVLDSDGMLVECCTANLFWRIGKNIFTPDLSTSGVNGIQRQKVMQQVISFGYTVTEVRCSPDILANSEEVLITNSLMPVLSVCQIQTWRYVSRQLFNLLNSLNYVKDL